MKNKDLLNRIKANNYLAIDRAKILQALSTAFFATLKDE